MRGPARRHRVCVRPRRGHHGRGGPGELAPALFHADRHRPSRGSTTRATSDPRRARGRAQHPALVPLTDLDHVKLRGPRRVGALVLLPPEESAPLRGQVPRARVLRRAGHPLAARWQPGRLPDERVPGPRQGARGFGSRHIYRANDRASSASSSATRLSTRWSRRLPGKEFSIDVFCDLEGRCLNAIPRTMIESKGGESIKGMTIQDPDLIERPPGGRGARDVGRDHPMLSRGRMDARVTDVNPRFGGAFPLPPAAGSRYPELALQLPTANGRAEAGRVSRGVVMTRFFSHIVLTAAEGGSLVRPRRSSRAAQPSRRGVNRLRTAALALSGRRLVCGGAAPQSVPARRRARSAPTAAEYTGPRHRPTHGPLARSTSETGDRGRRRRHAPPHSRRPRACVGWLSSEIRRHRRRRVHRLASLRGARGEGHEVVGIDCFTDYYDPALKEQNARALDVLRSTSPRRARLRGLRRRLPPRGPAGRAQLRSVFPLYVRQTCSRASASSRPRPCRRARRLRVLVVDLRRGRAVPDARRHGAAAAVAVRDHEAGVRAPRAAPTRAVRARRVVLRYFNAYGPRQRPDMAFPRVIDALVEGCPFTLFGDGEQSRSFTYVRDVVDASIRR